MYEYNLYGLKVKSDIFMKEISPSRNEEPFEPQVHIRYGQTPKEILNPSYISKAEQYSSTEMKFSIEEVGEYFVSKGEEIIVNPIEGCNYEDLKIFILGSSFGALMLQRNILAILLPNGCIIITGDSGAGKSTLTTGFRRKGYHFLSDDVCALSHPNKNKILVHPSYPQQKLCKDALHNFGYNRNSFTQIDEERDKYAIPCVEGFSIEAAPLLGIFELTVGDVENVEINEVFGMEKLKTLLKNIYRIEFTKWMGIQKEYMSKCIELAKEVSIFRIGRPRNLFTIEEQIQSILKVLT